MFNDLSNPIPLAKDPKAWKSTALILKHASEIIWNKFWLNLNRFKTNSSKPPTEIELHLIRPFLLLFGLSIENLLKGIIVKQNPNTYNRKVNFSDDGHDLIARVSEAGVQITQYERKLLIALSDSIRWTGKYPVPKKHGNTKILSFKLGMPFFTTTKSIFVEFQEYKELLNLLYKKLFILC